MPDETENALLSMLDGAMKRQDAASARMFKLLALLLVANMLLTAGATGVDLWLNAYGIEAGTSNSKIVTAREERRSEKASAANVEVTDSDLEAPPPEGWTLPLDP